VRLAVAKLWLWTVTHTHTHTHTRIYAAAAAANPISSCSPHLFRAHNIFQKELFGYRRPHSSSFPSYLVDLRVSPSPYTWVHLIVSPNCYTII